MSGDAIPVIDLAPFRTGSETDRDRVAPVALDRSRTSWAFFHHPNHDAVIRCLPRCDTGAPPVLAEPVTAGEYLWRKLEALTL